jgi:hypothetical protein
MTRQGPERAIGRLHPQFVNRLAAAIAEARGSGLPLAGIFSAYRPPAFGVGGFVDKFHSLHTYGLAVDFTGIGAPGTPDALLWHEIAARHGVICPYGPHNPVEWNHCQPTRVKIIVAENPLRQTVTADGPISLEDMFELGFSLIAGSDGIDGTAPIRQCMFSSRRKRGLRSGSRGSLPRRPSKVLTTKDFRLTSTAALYKSRRSLEASSAGRKGFPALPTSTKSYAGRHRQPRAAHCR